MKHDGDDVGIGVGTGRVSKNIQSMRRSDDSIHAELEGRGLSVLENTNSLGGCKPGEEKQVDGKKPDAKKRFHDFSYKQYQYLRMPFMKIQTGKAH